MGVPPSTLSPPLTRSPHLPLSSPLSQKKSRTVAVAVVVTQFTYAAPPLHTCTLGITLLAPFSVTPQPCLL